VYDTEFSVDGEDYGCDLLWRKSKVMLFTPDNEGGYHAAEQTNWKCFFTGDETLTAEKIADALEEE
jgi:hypothetical protein